MRQLIAQLISLRQLLSFRFPFSAAPLLQIGCQHACDVHHSAHHGTQTDASELHTMVDLYILGLADHVLPVTRSSFQRFADRGFGTPDRPQFLSGVAAPDPPVLPELEVTKRCGGERTRGCEGKAECGKGTSWCLVWVGAHAVIPLAE